EDVQAGGGGTAPGGVIEEDVQAFARRNGRLEPSPTGPHRTPCPRELGHVVRAPLVAVDFWKRVQGIVVPANPSAEQADAPSRRDIVQTEPLTRRPRTDRRSDHLTALRVALGRRSAGIE